MGSPAITWLGHASVLLELDGVRLITDPVLRDRIGPLFRSAEPVRLRSPETIGCVLLSHLHADHTDLPSLRALGPDVLVLAPRPAGAWLRRKGLRHVRELSIGQVMEVCGLEVLATNASHDPARGPLGPRAQPIGYLVRGSRSVYFAGDTDVFPEMAALHGTVDVALLPVAGWGPSVGSGHLDPDRASQAASTIAPRVAIPIHWGTFGLGPRRLWPRVSQDPAHEFAALTRHRAPEVEVRLLSPGERTEF